MVYITIKLFLLEIRPTILDGKDISELHILHNIA